MLDTDISITPDGVRSALELPSPADASEGEESVSDAALTKPIQMAQLLVNRDLAPYADGADGLSLTAEYLAAAIYREDGTLTRIQEGEGSVSFDTDDAVALLDVAKWADPTDRLEDITEDAPTGSISVPRVK